MTEYETHKKFLKEYYWNEILGLAYEYPDVKSLQISYPKIELFDRNLAKELLIHPSTEIENYTNALKEIDLPIDKTFEEVFIRVVDVPFKVRIGELRSNHIGKFVAIEGMIRKATEVRPRIVNAAFKCLRCGHITYVEQTGYKYEEPFAGCEELTCGKKGPFKLDEDLSSWVDAQKMQIQEPPEDLRGTQAQSLEVDASDDLTGLLLPGDRVIVTGILKSVQRTLKEGKSTFYDLLLVANSIDKISTSFDELEISSTDEAQILELSRHPDVYDKAINSIAPLIKGEEDVKEAMVLQQFSGVSKTTPDGSYLRGDSHILLCGDPSKGKTKFMKSAQARSPRSVFTSGKATSAAGLTAAVLKDDDKFGGGRYTVEGGVLVMADMGIAFIDEADKISASDRDSLHDAMEQQEINLSKAGIIATLKTRTSVLMSANPKYGKFDTYVALADQIDLPPSLLSRFDLIFVMLDSPKEKEDAEISQHILRTHRAGEIKQQRDSGNVTVSSIMVEEAEKHIVPEISTDLFRKYVAYAKKTVFPVLSEEAMIHIHDFYMSLRRAGINGNKNSIPITTRQEEAIVRLSEASARVRLSNTVTLEDAKRATSLMQRCLKSVGIDPVTGEQDVSMINTGTSLSQRNAIKIIKDIIKSQCKNYVGGKVPVVEVINEAGEQGIKKERAEETIKKLAQRGDILKPDADHVKLVN